MKRPHDLELRRSSAGRAGACAQQPAHVNARPYVFHTDSDMVQNDCSGAVGSRREGCVDASAPRTSLRRAECPKASKRLLPSVWSPSLRPVAAAPKKKSSSLSPRLSKRNLCPASSEPRDLNTLMWRAVASATWTPSVGGSAC